ncbi:flavoprotein [Micromonospora echinofusca]|uniref:Flavoprotein n=1 Tax=Micromonospora echinofusca TaxID=47858 RepID=A0ABS3VK05_MICEH|nr:flavoprotein [Micromonospora echinofusca]MBO4204808.1 flavoprotein [Micromonospora echinofusca]
MEGVGNVSGTPEFPEFAGRRLLVVVSGAVSAAFLPGWLNWLRLGYPDLTVQAVATRSAQQFVTLGTLSTCTGRPAMSDEWPEQLTGGAPHVELAEWADSIIVYPACLNFLARLALGLADTPAMLALQCAPAPVALAPALPPHGLESPAYRSHRAALEQRPNVVIAPPDRGLSASTGRLDASVAAPMPTVVRLLEQRRRALMPT